MMVHLSQPVIVALIGLGGIVIQSTAELIKHVLQSRRERTGGVPPTPRPGRPSVPKLAIFALLLLMAVVGGGVAVFGRGTPATELRITYPRDSAQVEMREMIRGTSRGLRGRDSVWVVVYIPDLESYFPQRGAATVQADGVWNAPVQIGAEDEGSRAFDILVVTADRNARAAFHRYLEQVPREGHWEGLKELPRGVVPHHRATVSRASTPSVSRDPEGHRVFVSPSGGFSIREEPEVGRGRLTVYDRAGGKVARVKVTQHSGGDFANDIKAVAWSADERRFGVMYHESGAGHVSIVDLDAKREIGWIPVDSTYHRLGFLGNGTLVVNGRRIAVAERIVSP
ncbi:MAG TPA: hypothetical protein VF092_20045 [Longimicrobium sp.]